MTDGKKTNAALKTAHKAAPTPDTRILEASTRNPVQQRRQRRCLPRTGRPRHDDEAIPEVAEFVHVLRQAEFIQGAETLLQLRKAMEKLPEALKMLKRNREPSAAEMEPSTEPP